MDTGCDTSINPGSIAFDIDSVIVDTMALFLDIARDDFHIDGIRYEDITGYELSKCLPIEASVIEDIVNRIQDGGYRSTLRPIPDAPEVLAKVTRRHRPVLLVTARPHPGPIEDWIHNWMPADASAFEIVATGSYEGKIDVLINRRMSHFVEDRLETCFSLQAAGITPILFRQPWNRSSHPFMEVESWRQLETLMGL